MDELFLFLRVAVALAAVLGLIWFVGRRFYRSGGGTGQRRLIRVVDRQGLAAKAAVAVVDVDGTRYVLGLSEQSVSLLDSYAAADAAEEAEASEPEQLPEADFEAELAQANPHTSHELVPVSSPQPPTQTGAGSRLHGTIFAPSTWRQAAEAIRRGRQQ
ncbi:flagellar biosynthetic protein FliO [Nesterenkonia populi]|uniref:flagellar biosynthetic protein FliO n=1 Tax=Nesterenkonia populi TaxID=1591087 RepID=UPI00147864EC|nr:flagellar biosynthetic protein FliO [Nesterenkonia populi]